MKQPGTPFRFVAASSLILIGKHSPNTLPGLARGLKMVSDVFYFCESHEVTLPAETRASNVKELAARERRHYLRRSQVFRVLPRR
jgi:hypothetical protein